MTHVLCAGDQFIRPEQFEAAIRAHAPERDLTFTSVTADWPYEPFRQIEEVEEAAGDVDELIEAIGDAEVVVTQLAPLTHRVFEAAPRLRFVGVSRGGPVNVNLHAATEAGVIVSFAPGRNAQAAAEYAIALILNAMRRVSTANDELHRGVWRGDYYSYAEAGGELAGATVGLVGYGAIGRIVARILSAFGAEVIAHDPYAHNEPGITLVDLDDLLRRSDIVSLHARLTPESHHILNAENLALLKPGAVLVNSARGGLLDYAPLPAMLRDGRLRALALDVYDVEPPTREWPLFDAPNVLLSPHLAGATRQTAARACSIIAGEVDAFLFGSRPAYVANPEVFERSSTAR